MLLMCMHTDSEIHAACRMALMLCQWPLPANQM